MSSNSNEMRKATVLAALQTFQKPLRPLDSQDTGTLLVEIIGKLAGEKEPSAEIKNLEKLSQSINLAVADLSGKKATDKTIPSLMLSIKAINSEIFEAQGALFSLTRNKKYLDDAEKKQQILYHIRMIQLREQQLALLAQQVEESIKNNTITPEEGEKVTEALLGTEYFKDQKGKPISIATWLADAFLPQIVSIGKQLGIDHSKVTDNAQGALEGHRAPQENEDEQFARQLEVKEREAEERRRAERATEALKSEQQLQELLSREGKEQEESDRQLAAELGKEEARKAQEARKAEEDADRQFAENVQKKEEEKTRQEEEARKAQEDADLQLAKNLEAEEKEKLEKAEEARKAADLLVVAPPTASILQRTLEAKELAVPSQQGAPSPKKEETVPEWLKELLADSNSVDGFRKLLTRYKKTEPYDKGSFSNIAQQMQPSAFLSKKRAKQLQLIEDTLILLKKGDYPAEKKTKIARGLMLFIKHQIDHEQRNVFTSRLGTMVNNYLNRPDNFDGTNRDFSAQECLESFNTFSSNLVDKNHKNMKQQISTVLGDTAWKEKQFYSLHQMINSINLNISMIPEPKKGYVYQNEDRGRQSRTRNDKVAAAYSGRGWSDSLKNLPSEIFIKRLRETLELIDIECGALGKLLAELKAGKDDPDAQSDLYLVSQNIKTILTSYDRAIKLAEEKISKLSNPGDIKKLTNELDSIKQSLKVLRGLYAPHAAQESPSQNRGYFPIFKNDNSNKKAAFQEAKALHDKIKAMPPLISEYPQLNDSEIAYNNKMQAEPKNPEPGKTTPLRSAEAALNTAKERYKNMNAYSIKNLSAKMLEKQIKDLTDDINVGILSLNEHLDPSKKKTESKEDIYIKFRKIEKQLETLEYLTKIAALKLAPSANVVQGVVRYVSDSKTKDLQSAFSNQELSDNVQKFGELRTRVLQKLEVQPKHSATP